MSISGSLIVGRTGLLTHQAAIQTAGNNLANLSTPGYHRQRVELASARPQEIQSGIFAGRGVQLQAITRQVNEALEARLRTALSDSAASDATYQMYAQVEAIQNEFSQVDLSTRLGEFFDAWSRLSNNPQDLSLRTLVTQEAGTLSQFVNTVRREYSSLRDEVDARIFDVGKTINTLLDRIEDINGQIVQAEKGAGGANGLRDQRDLALGELASLIDISTVETEGGVVDVFVGSTPLMLNGKSRGVEVHQEAVDGDIALELRVQADGTPLQLSSGEMGSLIQFRQQDMANVVDTLDQFASELIWQVNRLHSQGQGLAGFDSVTGTYAVDDASLALNDPNNGLSFTANHGSFRLHLTQASTGIRTSTTINIDLDNINPASNTTLNDLAAQISAVSGVTATVQPDGRLNIAADTGDFQVSFSDDSSGVLAALGINTFFTGDSASDIAVNQIVANEPRLVAASLDHLPGDNRTGLAIAGLRDAGVETLNGLSLTQFWNRHVEDVAVNTAEARQANEADLIVQENLQAQQQSVSGVNADEEAIDLMKYQRAYQASARFISIVDEMIQTLLGII